MTTNGITLVSSGAAAFIGHEAIGAPRGQTTGSALLPDPLEQLASTDDLSAQIAAVLIRSGQSERRADGAIADALDKSEAAAVQRRMDAMRDKAGHILAEGLASGCLQIASGALTIAGGLTSSDKTVVSREVVDAGTRTSTQTAHEVTMNTGYVYQALAKCTDGGAAIFSHFERAAQTLDDAAIARHEADAGAARRGSERAVEGVKDSKKLIDAALDFYKEYQSTQEQAKKAAIHGA